MKKNYLPTLIVIILMLTGIGLILYSNYLMLDYQIGDNQHTLRDVTNAARNSTQSYWVIGLVLMIGSWLFGRIWLWK